MYHTVQILMVMVDNDMIGNLIDEMIDFSSRCRRGSGAEIANLLPGREPRGLAVEGRTNFHLYLGRRIPRIKFYHTTVNLR